MVRQGGEVTLRDIRTATIEKLTNKILRAFVFDVAFVLPPLLLIGLEYGRAVMSPEIAGTCFEGLANWLMVYFCTILCFAVFKLLRVFILWFFPYQHYFYYVCVTQTIYFVTMFVLFVKGNFIFIKTLQKTSLAGTGDGDLDDICLASVTDPALTYDAKPLWLLMTFVLFVDWLVFLVVI